MVYADMAYYTNEYLGTLISDDDWDRLALRASSYIDYLTMGRAEKEVDKWKTQLANACCALAEQYQQVETAQKLAQKSLSAAYEFSGNIETQSETVGSWTRNYRSGGATAISAANAMTTAKTELYTVAAQYLATTGLLYRGGGAPCPCFPTL